MIVILVALAGAWFGVHLPPAEPVYASRHLSQWLDGGYEQASEALHEVGPAAVPVVFAKLRHEHPQEGSWQRYRRVWEKLPAKIQRLLPRPKTAGYDQWNACQALVEIGPRVIPTLAVNMKHHHLLVRCASAQALGVFRQRGADISIAVPALRMALDHPNRNLRREAAQALGLPPD